MSRPCESVYISGSRRFNALSRVPHSVALPTNESADLSWASRLPLAHNVLGNGLGNRSLSLVAAEAASAARGYCE